MPLNLALRPRLHFQVTDTSEICREKLLNAASIYSLTTSGDFLVLHIPKDRQHYWSPQLQITLEPQKNTTLVRALITPMPAVWTLFACGYGLTLTLGFFSSMYGLAQWQLKQPSLWLWALPMSLALIATLYIAAKIGQRIGHEQTEELTRFLHRCLKDH